MSTPGRLPGTWAASTRTGTGATAAATWATGRTRAVGDVMWSMTTRRVRSVTAAVKAATTVAGRSRVERGTQRATAGLDGPAGREVAVVLTTTSSPGTDAEALEHHPDGLGDVAHQAVESAGTSRKAAADPRAAASAAGSSSRKARIGAPSMRGGPGPGPRGPTGARPRRHRG